jgi:hypothetical protein
LRFARLGRLLAVRFTLCAPRILFGLLACFFHLPTALGKL